MCDDLGEDFSSDIDVSDTEDFSDDFDDVSVDDFSDDIEDIPEDDFTDDLDDVSNDDFSDDMVDISEDDFTDDFDDVSDDDFSDDMVDISEDDFTDDFDDALDDDFSDDIENLSEDDFADDFNDVSDDDIPEDEIVDDMQDVSDDIPEDEIADDTQDISDDIPEHEVANDPENTSNDISNAMHDDFNDFSTPNNENDNTEQSEIKSYDNLSDYMSDHNYGMDDFDTYSQDPVWRDLQKKEFPDYELPPLTQESAKSQLYDYMSEHNYGQDDFNTYSQDPKWRELQSAAFPDYELPPLVEEKSDIGFNENGRELTPANTIVDVNEIYNFNLEDEYEKLSSLDVEDLSKDEISSLERYSGSGYSRINRSLYDNEYRPLSTYEKELNEKDINTLTNCISRKEIPFDFKAYRGTDNMEFVFGDDINNMSLEELNKKYSGTYFVNKGFSSVSTDYDVANDFLGYSNKGGVMTIDVPKGSKGIAMGDVSVFKNGEKEVLLQRGSAYQIKSIDMDDNNRLRLHTKLVGQFGG